MTEDEVRELEARLREVAEGEPCSQAEKMHDLVARGELEVLDLLGLLVQRQERAKASHQLAGLVEVLARAVGARPGSRDRRLSEALFQVTDALREIAGDKPSPIVRTDAAPLLLDAREDKREADPKDLPAAITAHLARQRLAGFQSGTTDQGERRVVLAFENGWGFYVLSRHPLELGLAQVGPVLKG